MISLRSQKKQKEQDLGLNIFNQLEKIKKRLKAKSGVTHFRIKTPGVVQASFSTFHDPIPSNFETLSLELQITHLRQLPAIVNFLGPQWRGKITLAAKYFSDNEVSLTLQINNGDNLLVRQEAVYYHSPSYLIDVVHEMTTVGQQVQSVIANPLPPLVVDPLDSLLTRLGLHNQTHLSDAQQRTMTAIQQLRKSGAFALLIACAQASDGDLDLVLTRVFYSSYGTDYKELASFSLLKITPQKFDQELVKVNQEVAEWFSTNSNFFDRISHDLLLTVRYQPGFNQSFEVGYKYKNSHLFVSFNRESKRFRPYDPPRKVPIEGEIALNLQLLSADILSLLSPKEAMQLESILKKTTDFATHTDQLIPGTGPY